MGKSAITNHISSIYHSYVSILSYIYNRNQSNISIIRIFLYIGISLIPISMVFCTYNDLKQDPTLDFYQGMNTSGNTHYMELVHYSINISHWHNENIMGNLYTIHQSLHYHSYRHIY